MIKGAIIHSPLALLTLAAALAMQPAAAAEKMSAFEARCERDMRPLITVRSAPLDYEVHNSERSRTLVNRGARLYSGEYMLGVTSLQRTSTVDFDGPSLFDVKTQRECIAPRIYVTLAFRPIKVYVAREFAPDTCPYKSVLDHELRHVKLYEDGVPRLAGIVREQLAQRYGQRPLYAKPGEGLNRLQHDVDTWLRPMIRDELDKLEEAQLALETDEEVARLSASCQGQLAASLGLSY